MSLEQYNSLMSNLLNQKCTLTKLRAELKEKKGKVFQNKFGILVSKVIKCELRKEVKVRRQEMIKKEVQYFRCWKVRHYKQKYPMAKAKKEKRRWCVWSNYKRHSKKEDWHTLYGKRHKSIIRSRICLQKIYFYLREDS